MNCGARPLNGNSYCPSCGTQTNTLAEICIKCGTRLAAEQKSVVKKRTSKLTAIGILNIIAGAFNVLTGLVVVLVGGAIGVAGSVFGAGVAGGVVATIGLFLMIPGIVTVISGVYTLRKKYWGLALAGSILAFLAGWVWVFPAFMGIASIVLVAISKKEFD
jgi:hypothetical protein